MKNSIYTTWPLLLSVLILILNDHVLKYAYSGIVTGKISDFAGIFLIVLVSRELFPKKIKTISLVVMILFSYWKSPLSQNLIDFINSYSPLEFIRTVDYSDLFAFVIIPLAHLVYEKREKYLVEVNVKELLKVPAIILTVLGITGTSVLLPHHKYEIRKESSTESIDIDEAIEAIKNVTNSHNLICKKCEPGDNAGLFEGNEIRLEYRVLENNRGIEFDIKGDPGSPFFGGGSWEEMDQIKRKLQYSLGHQFHGMEFVIKLGNR